MTSQNNSTALRGWTLGLSLLTLAAGFLVANINVFNISLVYLGLFMAVITAGLLTNPWGGLAASGIAVFALIVLNQYVGIYPVQNRVVNIASELAVFLVAGPLAGWFSRVIEAGQSALRHWIVTAEGQAVYDNTFNTLKPEWSRVRLEEEMVRARDHARPLSIALFQFASLAEARREERVAALQALIRIARSSTTTPSVVAYMGENRVMLILPEHPVEKAQSVIDSIRSRVATELYFPDGVEALGKPLNQLGDFQWTVTSLGSEHGTVDELLQSAISSFNPE